MKNDESLRPLLEKGETASVEFKTSLADSRKIVETIAAMATIGGGVVLVGVRDDGTAVGAEFGSGAIERLTRWILTGTDPRVFVDIDQPVHQEHRLLRIRVPAGDGPPMCL